MVGYIKELGWVYFEGIFLGFLYIFLSILSVIWIIIACFQKSDKTQRKQKKLQIGVFFFIFFNCTLRWIQHCVLNEICPPTTLDSYDFCKNTKYFINVSKVVMCFDLLSEFLGFSAFFTISAMWASIYFTFYAIENSRNRGVSFYRGIVNFIYYSIVGFFAIIIFLECLFLIFDRQAQLELLSFRIVQITTRTFCCVVLSVSLLYFGWKVRGFYQTREHHSNHIANNHESSSSSSSLSSFFSSCFRFCFCCNNCSMILFQITMITIVCGGLYLVIAVANLSRFFLYVSIDYHIYWRSFWFNASSLIVASMDQFCQFCLLMFLIPERVMNGMKWGIKWICVPWNTFILKKKNNRGRRGRRGSDQQENGMMINDKDYYKTFAINTDDSDNESLGENEEGEEEGEDDFSYI